MRNVTTASPIDLTAAPGRVATPDLGELAEVARRYESRPASALVAWAYDRFGTDLILAASFQDCVLIDIVYKTVPDVEVAFLDTQYHFAETLWYVEQVKARYGLNLSVIRPERAPTTSGTTTPTPAAGPARSSRCSVRSRARPPG